MSARTLRRLPLPGTAAPRRAQKCTRPAPRSRSSAPSARGAAASRREAHRPGAEPWRQTGGAGARSNGSRGEGRESQSRGADLVEGAGDADGGRAHGRGRHHRHAGLHEDLRAGPPRARLSAARVGAVAAVGAGVRRACQRLYAPRTIRGKGGIRRDRALWEAEWGSAWCWKGATTFTSSPCCVQWRVSRGGRSRQGEGGGGEGGVPACCSRGGPRAGDAPRSSGGDPCPRPRRTRAAGLGCISARFRG